MSHVRIERVDALDCRLIVHDWAFAREQAVPIDANWNAHLAAGRKIWNGRVLVARDPGIVESEGRRVFTASYFETSFAAFLAHRDFGFPDPDVFNSFAMAALRSADGAFLLGRMAQDTANPGLIYFAAGTPDLGDVKGGRVDLAGSVMRELTEETGLTRADVEEGDGYAIVFAGGRIACIRPVRAHAAAGDVISRVRRFIASEVRPEMDDMVVVRTIDDLVADMPGFIAAYLRAVLEKD